MKSENNRRVVGIAIGFVMGYIVALAVTNQGHDAVSFLTVVALVAFVFAWLSWEPEDV